MSTSAMRAEENNTHPSPNTHTFWLLSCQCLYFCRQQECHGQKMLESSSFALRRLGFSGPWPVCLYRGFAWGKGFYCEGIGPCDWLGHHPTNSCSSVFLIHRPVITGPAAAERNAVTRAEPPWKGRESPVLYHYQRESRELVHNGFQLISNMKQIWEKSHFSTFSDLNLHMSISWHENKEQNERGARLCICLDINLIYVHNTNLSSALI